MRVWTLHPQYLDAQGLVALWRETLLAQKVLKGETKGYQNHPQLIRFKETEEPLTAIACYLREVHEEAIRRCYQFDNSKIGVCKKPCVIEETDGQLAYEWEHLKRKLSVRSPARFDEISTIGSPLPNPIFRIVPGEIRDWEKR